MTHRHMRAAWVWKVLGQVLERRNHRRWVDYTMVGRRVLEFFRVSGQDFHRMGPPGQGQLEHSSVLVDSLELLDY